MSAARWLLALAASITSGCDAQEPEASGRREVTFAFWNVENLFDVEDDPANRGDDEYLPAEGWTADRYALKRRHLAEVVAAVRPQLLGVAEVENRHVLEDLIQEPALASWGWSIAHVDSPDERGIDVALLHRAPFEAAAELPVELHEITAPGASPTRGILEVPLRIGATRLHVLVNHWPSRGGDRSGALRRVAGTTLRRVVDAILARDPTADILIAGDFNDEPFDASVVAALGAIRSRNAVLEREHVPALFNPSWRFLAEPDVGTYYYNAQWAWHVFDQVIVSKGLLDGDGFTLVEDSLAIHAPDALRDHHRRPRWFRRRRGGEWATGYSDHFMVFGRLLTPPR